MNLMACTGNTKSSLSSLSIETSSGIHTFNVEIADTAYKRHKGLMERTHLNENHGMLFIYPSLSLAPFWMKNTPLSLDIIYIDENKCVLQIETNTVSYSEKLIYPHEPYRYVLEVLAGTAEAIHLKVGDSVSSEAF